jgi:aspartyl-tRNA(Asn)/glutamyl-tRNA(Gln) amidotransferase subunit C
MAARPVIDRALVLRVAALARIELAEDEQIALARDLWQILEYVTKLEELDLSAVEPIAHGVDLPSSWREDEVVPGLGVELAVRAAPEPLAGFFCVPKVIE